MYVARQQCLTCVCRNNSLLKYAQCFYYFYTHTLFWRRLITLLSCSRISPATKILEFLLPCHGDSGVDQGKLFGPLRNGTVRVCPGWSLVRKQSESIQLWSPHEDAWQVALRKNIKSGSSTWQLCMGRRWLWTGTELPSTHLTKAMRVASTCGVNGRFKEEEMFSAFLCPWTAQAEQ